MSPLGNTLWRLNTGTVKAMFLNPKKHYSDQGACPPCPPNPPSPPCPPIPPQRCSMYDCRKYSHNLPQNNVYIYFECIPGIPYGVFRCTDGEVLGRGAGKCCWYQNPEYFSFHHMTFYDMNLHLRPRRKACPETGRKAT